MVGGIGRFLGRIFKSAGPKAAGPTAKPAAGEAPAPKSGVAAQQKDTVEKYQPTPGSSPLPKDQDAKKGPPTPVRPGSPSSLEFTPPEVTGGRTGGRADLADFEPVRSIEESTDLDIRCAPPRDGLSLDEMPEMRGKAQPDSEDEDSAEKGKA